MTTQVSILVKEESAISKMFSLKGVWNLFKKSAVYIYIDSEEAEPIYMEARDQPYLLELEPGEHAILFKDPKEVDKKMMGGVLKVATAIGMGAFSMGLGGSFTSGFSTTLDATSGKSIRDGFASFTLQEGDIFKLSCKPTHKGAVKVKALK